MNLLSDGSKINEIHHGWIMNKGDLDYKLLKVLLKNEMSFKYKNITKFMICTRLADWQDQWYEPRFSI